MMLRAWMQQEVRVMLSRRLPRWLRTTILFALLVARGAAANDESVSRRHFERGLALAQLGEHRAAIKEFELAFEANPRPSIVYNLAHEHRVLAEAGAVDEMRKAVDFYQLYLDMRPNAPE